MTRAVPASWREYQRRNRAAMLGMALGMPGITAICVAALLIGLESVIIVYPAALMVWLVWWAISAFRLVRWPCPRCGVPWLSSQPIEFTKHRKCGQCDLGLYEST
jgi:hypothetical protein